MLSLISEVLRFPLENLSLSRLATDSSPALGFSEDSFSPEDEEKKPQTKSRKIHECTGTMSEECILESASKQGQGTDVLTRFVFLCDGESAGSAKHYQIQKGVSTQSVSAMDAGTRRLPAGIQSGNHLISSIGMSDDLMGED